MGRVKRSSPEVPPACSLPLARQIEGREQATVRTGEHPRGLVHRIDLMSDHELDALRARHPESGALAMDRALAIEENLEQVLAEKQLDEARLAALPMRPILTVFVCMACGVCAPARAWRAWPIDRAMRASRLPERDILRIETVVREVLGDGAPCLDELDAEAIAELSGMVGHDFDEDALRIRLLELRVRAAAKLVLTAGAP